LCGFEIYEIYRWKFVAFGRKNTVLVKLMALTIYAKAGLLRPMTLPQGQGLAVARPRSQILALRPRPRTRINITELNPQVYSVQQHIRAKVDPDRSTFGKMAANKTVFDL